MSDKVHPADRVVSRRARQALGALGCDHIAIHYDADIDQWVSFVCAGDVVHAASQECTPQGAVDAVLEAAECLAEARRTLR